MIKYILVITAISAFLTNVEAQIFPPPPGFPGSTAIHKDSSIIIDWASGVTITRGPVNIQDPSQGDVTHGTDDNALGVADNNVVSLGDGGEAMITFSTPITNGEGPDFAVFENGFDNDYMELAFVEVSSDGINFHRFDAVSLVQTTTQLGNFSFSECSKVNNLAGKYRVFYGTPFDLEELAGASGLDVNNVTHIKLIDVVGSINPNWGTYDSEGNIINDPFPTEFASGGFDLDAVGVINKVGQSLGVEQEEDFADVQVYPNPTSDVLNIRVNGTVQFEMCDLRGRSLKRGEIVGFEKIPVTELEKGVYFVNFVSETTKFSRQIVIE